MLIILALFALVSAGLGADLVVENAVIYTLDPKQPVANRMAVRAGRIAAVGRDAARYEQPGIRRLDLGGRTVVPGFIDSHGHLSGLGDLLENIDLRHATSVTAIARMVRDRGGTVRAGEWIRGHAWDQTNWGGAFPTADDLASAGEHPVFLKRVDGHAAWVNRRALEIADITASTPDPPGGRIIRDAAGRPTGVLIDRAQALVAKHIPQASAQQVRDRIARAARECATLGLTGVHDAGISRADLDAYRFLVKAGELPIRIYGMIGGAGELWRDYLARGPEIGEKLTVRSIKLMADGAIGSRGAAMWQPYSDEPGNTGLLILTREQIESTAHDAIRRGFQVNTHAIGDRANRIVLDAYGAVLGGRNDKRFRIEHAQVVSLPDFALFAKYDVIASIQSTHATSDMRWAAARLGPDRLAGAWATQRFLRAGVRIANGSDFPVEDPNPLWGLYAAVTRQEHNGKPPGGFMPDQRLTREQALRSFTIDGAYAAFEEKDKGTLESGKLADFVVLSHDIIKIAAADLLKTRVLMTVVGGEIVHSSLP
ncbi:MAG TPA: amidohydrolase [Bryobacteraceae bacterium]|nr:amidohydrolase [Bryobacteraceae bacterium]